MSKPRALPPGVEDGEVFIDTVHGEKLVFESFRLNPKGVEYVRIVSENGVELAYWDSEEWREDPQGVMGAILGAVRSGTSGPTSVGR